MSTGLKRGPAPRLTTRDEFELWQMRESGVSVKDCASWFNVSVATTFKALARLRKRFGRAERLPNERRARSHLTHPELSTGK